ncbi:D-alanine--D-alanine ligase [Aliarcobacter cibarius]|jgi:D-alanine-D-alanine ligase|uniref:D-alanine--D-alanine ligase n=1 Tax=Aliarcobacter cibarius TaxID=255507 RepID=A0A5J6RHX0_9BACT|nr:D-alanine--D-alanine ligase [Aliarcobacter cibarius]QEZ89515.1 D-alanine--D-alanine ligase [Aliarcobacter cibarius]QKJ27516.1 D-alanine--D-alanine ligase [Aliarcobacter cibarius]TLS99236.1 D-alanine--D-alanine ligase [Aliarcobacter cibarius]TLT00379.1 D-alanine--D-alanine ligase [Aliarcobacter cibarius]TLT04405.1 D-alanine--D-alanine ligase [Aliarcobacter cibarius]
MKIAIVFGGLSYEHEISIVSSIAMKDVLRNELVYIFIDKNRDLYEIPSSKINSKLFSSGNYSKFDKVFLKKGGFYKLSGLFKKEQNIDFDVALNLSHGGDGEDGILSSVLDFYNIPFIAPRTEACVVSSNKFITKGYAQSVDVLTLPYKYYTKSDSIKVDMFPVILKPVKLGSSIGVAIVKNQEELSYALDVAFEFDDAIIIEPFISGVKEYNLAGTKVNGEFIFSIIEEPQKTEFLDFDKKYLDFSRTSKAKEVDLGEKLNNEIKESFKRLYNTIFEGSIIRCDFFVVEDKVYLNEINSIPGSMANYLFSDFQDLFTKVASNLPKKKHIPITYEYVNKIQSAKGK